jgi:integrase
MANSKSAALPKKPRPDFPLTPRGDGRWCKRVHGKLRYITGTAQEALDEWNRVKDYWLAGREPPPKGGYLSLSDLVNEFLHHKKQRLDSGELAPRTWQGYEAVGKTLVAFFGRTFPAEQLTAADFQKLRAKLATRYGPVALGNRIQIVRMIFKYGKVKGLLAKDANYGGEFDKPSKKTLRAARNAKGTQAFTAQQIKALLAEAKQPMKAMILLAINGGLGNTDLALITEDRFDLDGGWLDYPRPKTAMPRRIPLWPETLAAVREAIAKRRPHKNPSDEKLLFIGARGTSYVNHTGGHRVAAEFAHLRDNVGIKDRVFYDLRRTFETIADNLSRDRDGVKAIMGHAPDSGDMSAVYRQCFDETRLRCIVDLVHDWLYAEPAKGVGNQKGAKKATKGKAVKSGKATPRKASPAVAEGFQLRIVG